MKTVFYIFSILVNVISAFNPGMTASIDWAMLEQAKDVFLPYVLNALNKAEIPDIAFSSGSGYAKNNTFIIMEPAGNTFLRPVATDGSIEFSISNLTAHFGSDNLHYQKFYVFTANGSLNVEITELSLYIRFKLLEKTLKDGSTVPSIEVLESKLNIPPDRLNVTIKGDNFMKCVSDIEFAFNSEYRGVIDAAVTRGIKGLLPPIFDAVVAKQDARSMLFDQVSLDWQISQAPIVNHRSLEIGMKGLFFQTKAGESGAPPAPPKMPYHDKYTKSEFQVFLSTYVVNSLADTLIKNNQLQFTLNAKAVPTESPIKLDTTYLDGIFPGLADIYGKDRPVDLQFNILKSNVLTIGNKERINYQANTGVKFWVEQADGTKDLAIDFTVDDLLIDLQVLVFGQQPWLEAKEIHLGSIIGSSSKIANFNLTAEVQNINKLFKEGLPIFNYWFKLQHFRLPETLFGIFHLSDARINYYNGFLEVAFTPTFIAPSESAFVKPQISQNENR